MIGDAVVQCAARRGWVIVLQDIKQPEQLVHRSCSSRSRPADDTLIPAEVGLGGGKGDFKSLLPIWRYTETRIITRMEAKSNVVHDTRVQNVVFGVAEVVIGDAVVGVGVAEVVIGDAEVGVVLLKWLLLLPKWYSASPRNEHCENDRPSSYSEWVDTDPHLPPGRCSDSAIVPTLDLSQPGPFSPNSYLPSSFCIVPSSTASTQGEIIYFGCI
ncbi:hypothetical protein J6590_003032 [Homalodisca vitripennis]|nr:hypothetical protein J6590_003032 [Homalodisca vitripennis]